MDREALAERRLRSLAESVVATATAPVHEGMEALEGLSDAAAALVGAGSLGWAAAEEIVSETIDALVVRGADWIAPAVPELDAGCLVTAGTAGASSELNKVVASARASAGEVASVELWSDRCIVRFFDSAGPARMGAPAPLRELPAIDGDLRDLEVQWETFEHTQMSLESGRSTEEVEARGHPIDPSEYLRRLAIHLAATALVETSLEEVDALRRRLAVSARILDQGASTASLLAAFDRTVTDVMPEWSEPEEAVAVGLSAGGLSFVSLERWSDHWRVFVSGGPDRARGRFWTAEAYGASYGGLFVGDDRIDFFPALPGSWGRLSLDLVEAGRCHSFEVRR